MNPSHAPALVLLLATAPTAWTQEPTIDKQVLSFESTQFELKGARVRCLSDAVTREITDACELFNELGVILTNPGLERARRDGRTALTSIQSQDQYGGAWVVFFSPGEKTAAKADFPGYTYSKSSSGQVIDVVVAYQTERPRIVGQGYKLLNKVRVSGYDHASPVYRGQW